MPVASSGAGSPPAKPNAASETVVARPELSAPTTAAAEPGLSEVALQGLARCALANTPERTLGLLDEHQRRFPEGPLTEEADIIHIEALTRLGRLDEAKMRTERFHTRYPASLHGRTIDLSPRP
jgi:hypothetical protein